MSAESLNRDIPWNVYIPTSEDDLYTPEVLWKDIDVNGYDLRLALALGDITKCDTDAIVVPSNPGFVYTGSFGGGVQAAVYRVFGETPFRKAVEQAHALLDQGRASMGDSPDTQETANKGGFPFATAVTTDSFAEGRISKIIHINSMTNPDESGFDSATAAVKYAVKGILRESDRQEIQSIAIPAINSGAFSSLNLFSSLQAILDGSREYFLSNQSRGALSKVSVLAFYKPNLNNIEALRKMLA